MHDGLHLNLMVFSVRYFHSSTVFECFSFYLSLS